MIDRLYRTFGDSDVRTTICVSANPSITRRIIGDAGDRWLTFSDPEDALAKSLSLERLPKSPINRSGRRWVTPRSSGWRSATRAGW